MKPYREPQQETTGAMLDNYYQHFPEAGQQDSERFPSNHVRYAFFLKPLELLNVAHVRFGRGPLAMRDAFLKEFDAAAPDAACLGTPQELAESRAMVVTMGEGFDRNPNLSGIGRALVKKICMGFLQARRFVLAHYQQNKSFIDTNGRVEAPLIITGLPRTGSTLLQRLIAEDPNTRSPYTYEMEVPLPPLARGADPLKDPRIKASGAAFGTMSRLAPGFVEKLSESHRWDATEFEESFIYMLLHNGMHMVSAPAAGMEYIRKFVALEGKRSALRYERTFFTMLDAYRPAPSHWTLKAPNYAPVFPLVFDEYPDVRMVVTHRNPLVTFPSICRLLESWNIAFDRDGTFDKHRFAQFTETIMDACINGPFAYRKANPGKERQIFDCLYDELFADPVAMVKRIYSYFDLEVTPVFEQRMKTYLANNQQGKYGRHRYSLEEYGIDAGRYFETHRDYMTTYGFENAAPRKPRATHLAFATAGS